MIDLTKVWESSYLVRFSDCDPFNHLNNARYIDYFINAREDHLLANMKFNIYEYAAEHGVSWVVTKNQVVYLKPAFLMEKVVIDSTILRLGEKDLIVEMKMWNENKDKLKSVLWTTFAHVNIKTWRSHTHSQQLMQMFRRLENPLPSTMTFDQRVEQLRNA